MLKPREQEKARATGLSPFSLAVGETSRSRLPLVEEPSCSRCVRYRDGAVANRAYPMLRESLPVREVCGIGTGMSLLLHRDKDVPPTASGQGCPSYQEEIGNYAESLSFKTPM